MTSLERSIMRRVYYSYLLSFLTQAMVWQGIAFMGSLYLFGRLTHVASIVSNFLATPLSNAPNFIINAFTHALAEGRILTVLISILIAMISVSIVSRLILFFANQKGQYRPV